jgi:hypothetical protein
MARCRRTTAPLPPRHKTDAYQKAFALRPTNFEAAYNIAEHYRARAWQGLEDHKSLATNAMQWFQTVMGPQPVRSYGPMRYAMCLDCWENMTRPCPYFQRA